MTPQPTPSGYPAPAACCRAPGDGLPDDALSPLFARTPRGPPSLLRGASSLRRAREALSSRSLRAVPLGVARKHWWPFVAPRIESLRHRGATAVAGLASPRALRAVKYGRHAPSTRSSRTQPGRRAERPRAHHADGGLSVVVLLRHLQPRRLVRYRENELRMPQLQTHAFPRLPTCARAAGRGVRWAASCAAEPPAFSRRAAGARLFPPRRRAVACSTGRMQRVGDLFDSPRIPTGTGAATNDETPRFLSPRRLARRALPAALARPGAPWPRRHPPA